MWRKSADEKNNSQSSNVPEPVSTVSTAPKAGQTPPPAVAQTAAVPTNIVQTAIQASTAGYSAPSTAALRANSVSVIGAGLKIQGEITGDSDLVVEGEAHGRIRMMNGRVTVAANGRVNADIEAVEISVDGIVQGGLKASDRVRLGPASLVQGSVLTRRIAIEDGARLRGKVEMIRAGEVAAPVPQAPTVSAAASSTPVSKSTAAPTAVPAMGAAPNVAKASEAATPAIATEADRLKATAARGSGD